MLQELRESIIPPLTRSQLAEELNRSPGYILKAESLTFPAVPPSLLDFYVNRMNYPRPLLISQYRNAQRTRRRRWLHYWRPASPNNTQAQNREGPGVGALQVYDRPFTDCWTTQFPEQLSTHPTEYAISQGLCIPAAAVYNAQHKNKIARSILVAFQDLEDYCVSGEVFNETHLTEADITNTLNLIVYWNGVADRAA